MDPAESQEGKELNLLQTVLASQGTTLGQHDQLLQQVLDNLHSLAQAFQQSQAQAAQAGPSQTPAVSIPASNSSREPRLHYA
ncbi:hypothetical protein AAFF_G00045650, partial [Aldrovandia affinis]